MARTDLRCLESHERTSQEREGHPDTECKEGTEVCQEARDSRSNREERDRGRSIARKDDDPEEEPHEKCIHDGPPAPWSGDAPHIPAEIDVQDEHDREGREDQERERGEDGEEPGEGDLHDCREYHPDREHRDQDPASHHDAEREERPAPALPRVAAVPCKEREEPRVEGENAG